MMTPREWLAQEPLQDGEQVFVILASTSECQPAAAWRQVGGAVHCYRLGLAGCFLQPVAHSG